MDVVGQPSLGPTAYLMSDHKKLDAIRQVEETLHGVIKHELDSRGAEFCAAGLQVDLDPIYRSGEGSNYVSYVETTLRYADGDVHDIVWSGVPPLRWTRLTTQWIIKTIDESLSKASETNLLDAADESRADSG